MARFRLRHYANIIWDSELKLPIPEEMGKKVVENNWILPEIDIRSRDVSELDLSVYDMQYVAFDDRTKWSADFSRCPKGYDRLEQIIKLGKDPGLGVQVLHKKGIDGSGLSMAIIDQPLSDHIEYHDNLIHYEELGYDKVDGSMHGAAVSSIAVGKTCGVAPKAKVHYFAANNKKIKNGQEIRTAEYRIQALKRILKINESLSDKDKIQIVSISAGWMGSPNTEKSDEWNKIMERAQRAGLFVLTTISQKDYGLGFTGLGREVYSDSNQLNSYIQSRYNTKFNSAALPQKTICIPMEHRTIASPTGKNEYVHYFDGGMSWATPWLAANFLLARQVSPTITPEHFWDVALKTGMFNKKLQGTIIQPLKLISALQKERASYNMKRIMKTGQKRAIKRKTIQKKFLKLTKGEENAK